MSRNTKKTIYIIPKSGEEDLEEVMDGIKPNELVVGDAMSPSHFYSFPNIHPSLNSLIPGYTQESPNQVLVEMRRHMDGTVSHEVVGKVDSVVDFLSPASYQVRFLQDKI